MKKCVRCNVVFHSDERTRCLYCDTMLVAASAETGSLFEGPRGDLFRGVAQFLKAAGRGELDRKNYIIGSYFRSRTFHSMYLLCRNDLRLGADYGRFLVRPLDISAFLALPWFFINLLDSIFLRFLYIGFCQKCGYKYQPQMGIVGHQKEECEYYQEYNSIIEDIMSGRIVKTEDEHLKRANEKYVQGRRSAYVALCSQKSSTMVFLDIMTVWLTVCFYLFLIVRFTLPSLVKFVGSIELEF